MGLVVPSRVISMLIDFQPPWIYLTDGQACLVSIPPISRNFVKRRTVTTSDTQPTLFVLRSSPHPDCNASVLIFPKAVKVHCHRPTLEKSKLLFALVRGETVYLMAISYILILLGEVRGNDLLRGKGRGRKKKTKLRNFE